MRNDCTYHEKDAVTLRKREKKACRGVKKCMANNGETPIFQSKCHRNCIKYEKEMAWLFEQRRALNHVIVVNKMNA